MIGSFKQLWNLIPMAYGMWEIVEIPDPPSTQHELFTAGQKPAPVGSWFIIKDAGGREVARTRIKLMAKVISSLPLVYEPDLRSDRDIYIVGIRKAS